MRYDFLVELMNLASIIALIITSEATLYWMSKQLLVSYFHEALQIIFYSAVYVLSNIVIVISSIVYIFI